MNYKISVIIPTYKPGTYIKDCLNSISEQSISKLDFEVIIVLNGCNEPYYSYINTLVKNNLQGLKVTLIQIAFKGASCARNIGINVAQGEYIAFVDDDDWLSPSYLQELYKVSTSEIVALSNVVAVEDNGTVVDNYRIENEYLKRAPYGKQRFYKAKKFFSGACMKLLHRDIVGDRRFNEIFELGEDSIFMFLVSDRIKFVNFTSPKAVYYRRIRIGSMTNNERKLSDFVHNSFAISNEYLRIYFQNSCKHNFYFLITRIVGVEKTIIIAIIKKILNRSN